LKYYECVQANRSTLIQYTTKMSKTTTAKTVGVQKPTAVVDWRSGRSLLECDVQKFMQMSRLTSVQKHC